MNDRIDFVVMWVDGSDTLWLAEKSKYDPNVKTNADSSIYRYRDYGLMKYWFRGIEKYASWVNKIYFVTWGHIPEWLDTSNEKLVIVKHEDFIPKEYLPTFSANTIELNLHRINGLSERFVLFNDDLYLIDYTKPDDFFSKDGLPMDTVALNVHCPKKSLISQYFCINDTSIINEHFDFKKSLNNNKKKWFNIKNGKEILRTLVLKKCPRFPGFYQHHLTNSYYKSTFDEVWEKEYEILNNTCLHKFRETSDVNQWVMKEWQIASGKFEIRSHRFGKSFYIDRDGFNAVHDASLYIANQTGKMISVNDGYMTDQQYSEFVEKMTDSFDKILREKSSFEK